MAMVGGLSRSFRASLGASWAAGLLPEVGALAAAGVRLPANLRRRSSDAVHYRLGGEPGASGTARAPVLVVHGFASSERVWSPVRSALADAGFTHLVALRYDTLRSDVVAVAETLVEEADRVMTASGVPAVHLVGHSLGGLVVRYAAQWLGLGAAARTVVTIATPHSGTWLARWGPGACARQMRPGSRFLTDLGGSRLPSSTRWVAYYSDGDLVVPGRSGMLDDGSTGVVNIRLPTPGHLSIAGHPEVVSSIVSELLRSEARIPATAGALCRRTARAEDGKLR